MPLVCRTFMEMMDLQMCRIIILIYWISHCRYCTWCGSIWGFGPWMNIFLLWKLRYEMIKRIRIMCYFSC